ncbi:thioredoxin domain-containing protein [Candidatus Woesearchaeota archaeon]|nr:thioredoxin domain-containing protein [Candidatus Woesearchaeota archaeon]
MTKKKKSRKSSSRKTTSTQKTATAEPAQEKALKSESKAPSKPGIWQAYRMPILIIIAVIVVAIALVVGINSNGNADGGITPINTEAYANGIFFSERGETLSENAVPIELYVMSICPYGIQAENGMFPALKEFGTDTALNISYIANEANGEFTSLHQQPEVDGDIYQLCVKDMYPNNFFDFVLCQNKNPQGIPGNWEDCAEEQVLNKMNIQECFDGQRGKELLSESIKESQAAQASGSPTIYIGGQRYSGPRDDISFKRAICTVMEDAESNDVCSALPPVKEVNMIFLNDRRCAECQNPSLVPQLKTILPGLQARNLDYNDVEGKQMYKELGLQYLPALLFEKDVIEAPAYTQLERYLIPTGDYYSLMVGASFDPTKEICDNSIDDTDNGLTDCDDPDCEQAIECRPEIEKHVQLFIMSDCPYGREAVKALGQVLETFSDLDYEINYIVSETAPGQFNSLHGAYEVEEDMRQLCAKEQAPEDYFDYVLCRSTNGVNGKDWKDCAEQAGLDTDALAECTDGSQGKALLSANAKIGNALQISASPTWMANNRYKFSGISADQVQTNICAYNEGWEGCDEAIDTPVPAVPAGTC